MEEVAVLNFTKGQEVYRAVVVPSGKVQVFKGSVIQAGAQRIRVSVILEHGVVRPFYVWEREDQRQGLPKDAGLALWQPTPEDAVAHLLAQTVRRVKSAQEEMRQAQAELLAVEQYTGVSVKV